MIQYNKVYLLCRLDQVTEGFLDVSYERWAHPKKEYSIYCYERVAYYILYIDIQSHIFFSENVQ